jgi:hypothetical protein
MTTFSFGVFIVNYGGFIKDKYYPRIVTIKKLIWISLSTSSMIGRAAKKLTVAFHPGRRIERELSSAWSLQCLWVTPFPVTKNDHAQRIFNVL